MKVTLTILMAHGLCCALVYGGGTMVHNGEPVGKIVLQANASPSEKWAATELVDHFKQMSGAEVEIVTAPEVLPENAILLGNGKAAKSLGVKTDSEVLGVDGHVFKTVGNRLVIAGSAKCGTLYGVYGLLDRLGCRWWYPGESTVPTMKTIELPELNLTDIPALDYRDLLYGETSSSSDKAKLWRARNRMNGGMFKTQEEKYGGQLKHKRFTHSYWDLIGHKNVAGLLKEHPEYFALTKYGRRSKTQPCFSSEEMVKRMAEGTIKAYEANPEWLHHTIGQEDNYDYCRCDGCKALFEEHGGSGMQLHFALRVAKIVREKYPDIPLNVPAYTWTRTPPKSDITPADNMAISLGAIECSFARPIEEGVPHWNAEVAADLQGWSKLASRVNIWTYSTSFKHYLIPFPNYYTTGPNVRFFVRNKVKGMIAQGSHTTVHGSLAPLDIWLWGKLMWNPEQDERALVKEFVDGYYGPASKHILGYLNDLHASMIDSGSELYIRMNKATGPSYPLFTAELVEKTEQHFLKAAEAVKDDPVLLKRIQIAHLPMQYVVLKRFRQLWPTVAKANPGLTPAEYCKLFSTLVPAIGMRNIADHMTSEHFCKWAVDYGKMMTKDPKADLPEELKEADLSKVIFLQAAQWDAHQRFLKTNENATDGWVLDVFSHGWAHQHQMRSPFSYKEGKVYDIYARARATADETLKPEDVVLNIGLAITGDNSKRQRVNITAADADGTFKTFHVGRFTGFEHDVESLTHNDGTLWTARNSKTGKQVSDAELDCVWLVEK